MFVINVAMLLIKIKILQGRKTTPLPNHFLSNRIARFDYLRAVYMSLSLNRTKNFGTFTLTLICISACFNLRNLPLIAQYGIESLLLYPVFALCFLIPCGFACAELSSGWPNAGGMYVWIRNAFGYKLGFLAVWLDWIINLIWFPLMLSFMVGTLAYLVDPVLAKNKIFMCGTMLAILWMMTLINFFGINFTSRFSSMTALFGSLIPCLLLIIIGLIYFVNHHQEAIENLTTPTQHLGMGHYSYAVGLILSFAGIEAAGLFTHSKDDLKYYYPKAIFYSISIIISGSLLGALAIGSVLSVKEINLVSGFIESFQKFSEITHLAWLPTMVALVTIIGSLSALNTWIAGPTSSLKIVVSENNLPKILSYKNSKNAPITLLIIQALLSTLLISIFLLMPTVNDSYWLLTVLASQLTLIMYVLLFASVIWLRKSQPHVQRLYPIPGGNVGAYLMCGIGIATCLAAISIGFIPPEQLGLANIRNYEYFLLGGLLFLLSPAVFSGRRINRSIVKDNKLAEMM